MGDSALSQETQHFLARRAQQRPDDPPTDRPHTAQSRPSRAAQQPQQHRFGLVVGRVRHGDPRRAELVGRPFEEGVADFPRGLLEIAPFRPGSGGHVVFLGDDFQTQRRGELGAVSLVAVALRSAQPVVEVRRGKLDLKLAAHFVQGVEQSGGVGTAGDGYEHQVAGGCQGVHFECFANCRD